jgi:MOSC domain-containing protein YiiM
MVKLFMASRRTGFYFAVLKEGQVNTSDTFELLGRDKNGVTVADITRLYAFDKTDVAAMQRAVQVEALPASWVDYFRQRLEKL